jgi:hypothetical protein
MSESKKSHVPFFDTETLNFLTILSRQVRIPRSTILKEVVSAMAHVSANYAEANCSYILNYTEDTVTIQFLGRKTIQHGKVENVTDEQTDESLLKGEGVQ